MSLPIAIAVARMATAERGRRAEVELIAGTAMVGAIPAVAMKVEAAMVAKARRQRKRTLPIDRDQRFGGRTAHSARLRRSRPSGKRGKHGDRAANKRRSGNPHGRSPKKCDQRREHAQYPPPNLNHDSSSLVHEGGRCHLRRTHRSPALCRAAKPACSCCLPFGGVICTWRSRGAGARASQPAGTVASSRSLRSQPRKIARKIT
jgi:hypothetical protein